MRFNKMIVVVLATCSAVCMTPKTLTAQQTMNNDDVIKLVKAGLSDDLIVSTISSQAGKYNTSPEGLIALKNAGVSDKIVSAIVTKGSAPAPATASVPAANNPNDPAQIHSPGIYILTTGLDKHTYLTKIDHVVPKEIKTGGFMTAGITYGIKKAHISVLLEGPKASIQTPDTNPTFYVYIPEDNTKFGGNSVSVKDFSLIKFEVKGKLRQANIATIGISGASVGADEKQMRDFTSEAVKPGIYKLILSKPLAAGEYAFQQTGTATSTISQNGGSYFDFGIVANK